jgi:hypothetical protein
MHSRSGAARMGHTERNDRNPPGPHQRRKYDVLPLHQGEPWHLSHGVVGALGLCLKGVEVIGVVRVEPTVGPRHFICRGASEVI